MPTSGERTSMSSVGEDAAPSSTAGSLFGNLEVRPSANGAPARIPLPGTAAVPSSGAALDLDSIAVTPNPAASAGNASAFDFMGAGGGGGTPGAGTTPAASGFGFMTSTPAPAPEATATESGTGFDFMTPNPAPTTGGDSATPASGFGFMSATPTAADTNTTPAAPVDLFSDLSTKSGSAATRGPIVVQKRRVAKKRSARKRIGFDRAAAMADLKQQKPPEPAPAPAATPAPTSTTTAMDLDSIPITPNPAAGASAGSLLSGMTIHKSSKKGEPSEGDDVETDVAPAPAEAEKETVVLPTYRGSIAVADDDAVPPGEDAAAAPPPVPVVVADDEAPEEPDAFAGIELDVSAVMRGGAPGDEGAETVVPPPEDEPPAGVVEESPLPTDDFQAYVQRVTAELTALETGQGETEAEQRKAQETVESYRTELAMAEKKQAVAIEQEDYDAAEQFNVSISDYQQLLQSAEGSVAALAAALAKNTAAREAIMDAQVAQIEAMSEGLGEKEGVEREKLKGFERERSSRKGDDEKRLRVLVQRLELEEETMLTDSKSLGEDRAVLDEKVATETATHTGEKEKWEGERARVQADIDALMAQLREKEGEMKGIVERVDESETNISRIMEIYAPRQAELAARQGRLDKKQQECVEQKERIASTEENIRNHEAIVAAEHADLVGRIDQLSSEQTLIRIVRAALLELKGARESMAVVTTENGAVHQSMRDDVGKAKQALSVVRAEEGEIEATLAEIRNRVEVLEQKIPSLEGEKKRAVAAKNFKAAKQATISIKEKTAEKGGLQTELEAAAEELNRAVQRAAAAHEAVEDQEGQLAAATKEGDLTCLKILRGQRRIVKGAIRKIERVPSTSQSSAVDILAFALSASRNEIEKICAKHGVEDVEEEEVEDEEERGGGEEVGGEAPKGGAADIQPPTAEAPALDAEDAPAVPEENGGVDAPGATEGEGATVEEEGAAEGEADDGGAAGDEAARAAKIADLQQQIEDAVAVDDFDKADELQQEVEALEAAGSE